MNAANTLGNWSLIGLAACSALIAFCGCRQDSRLSDDAKMERHFGKPTFQYVVDAPDKGHWEARYPKTPEFYAGEIPFAELPRDWQQWVVDDYVSHPDHMETAIKKSIEGGFATEEQAQSFLKDVQSAARSQKQRQ